MKAPDMDEPPTIASLSAKIEELQHHTQTVLFLSAINMVMNVLTIGIGFLMAM
jgi:hypothetical protein